MKNFDGLQCWVSVEQTLIASLDPAQRIHVDIGVRLLGIVGRIDRLPFRSRRLLVHEVIGPFNANTKAEFCSPHFHGFPPPEIAGAIRRDGPPSAQHWPKKIPIPPVGESGSTRHPNVPSAIARCEGGLWALRIRSPGSRVSYSLAFPWSPTVAG